MKVRNEVSGFRIKKVSVGRATARRGEAFAKEGCPLDSDHLGLQNMVGKVADPTSVL